MVWWVFFTCQYLDTTKRLRLSLGHLSLKIQDESYLLNRHFQVKRTTIYLLPAKKEALKNLCYSQDIVTKPANKVSVVVVLSKLDYIREAKWLLSSSTHYQKLSSDPTLKVWCGGKRSTWHHVLSRTPWGKRQGLPDSCVAKKLTNLSPAGNSTGSRCDLY